MPKTRFPSNGLKLVSLFAGCGGSSLGYSLAGYEVRLAVEWDKDAAACYRTNFTDTRMHCGDIVKLDAAKAMEMAGVDEGELDVLDGSPPCQGFSTAGKRKFADNRNGLFLEYVRLLSAFRPRAFVMENVSGLRKGKMRLIFADMTKQLKASGYRVSCRELNAWWYGVPQERRRLIWVGMRDDMGLLPSHPQPTQKRPVTVADALGIGGGRMRRRVGYDKTSRTCNLPAYTIMSSGPSKITMKDGRYRDLTIEENKILQGFPDWFKITKYRQIGNSVAPPMAEAIGRHLAVALERLAGMGLEPRQE